MGDRDEFLNGIVRKVLGSDDIEPEIPWMTEYVPGSMLDSEFDPLEFLSFELMALGMRKRLGIDATSGTN